MGAFLKSTELFKLSWCFMRKQQLKCHVQDQGRAWCVRSLVSYSVSDLWLSCNLWTTNKAAALIGCWLGVYLWFSSAAIVAVTLSF